MTLRFLLSCVASRFKCVCACVCMSVHVHMCMYACVLIYINMTTNMEELEFICVTLINLKICKFQSQELLS